jgi:hypothetical protein
MNLMMCHLMKQYQMIGHDRKVALYFLPAGDSVSAHRLTLQLFCIQMHGTCGVLHCTGEDTAPNNLFGCRLSNGHAKFRSSLLKISICGWVHFTVRRLPLWQRIELGSPILQN